VTTHSCGCRTPPLEGSRGRAQSPRPTAIPDTEALAPPVPHAGESSILDSRAECRFFSCGSQIQL